MEQQPQRYEYLHQLHHRTRGAHLAVLPSGVPRIHGGRLAVVTPSRGSWTVYFGRRDRKSLWRCRVADQGID